MLNKIHGLFGIIIPCKIKIIRKPHTVLLTDLRFLSCNKKFENSMISRKSQFFSIVPFKEIFDIPLPNNLFISFLKLFIYLIELKNVHSKHPLKEQL